MCWNDKHGDCNVLKFITSTPHRYTVYTHLKPLKPVSIFAISDIFNTVFQVKYVTSYFICKILRYSMNSNINRFNENELSDNFQNELFVLLIADPIIFVLIAHLG